MSPSLGELEKKKQDSREGFENFIAFAMFVAAIFVLAPPITYVWKLWANYWGWGQ